MQEGDEGARPPPPIARIPISRFGMDSPWYSTSGNVRRVLRQKADRAELRAYYGSRPNRTEANEEQQARRDADGVTRGFGRYRRYRRRGRYTRRRYRGRGLYAGKGGFWGDLWNKTSGIRSHLGGMARASSNPWIKGAGTISGLLGTGAYDTVNNEIVDGGAGMDVPQFSAGGGEMGTITISHREYVADVFGPDSAGVFQNITYGLNPALPETFPWLSQVASNYEEYTIKQLIFTFRSTVTDFVASNGQVGTILLATQYNANDAPFASKQDMMEYAGAVSAKVSQQVVAGVECDPAQLSGPPGKYTRSGPTPPSEDVKTYDLGTLNVATANTPSQFNNQAVGELWVSYTIELRKPKFFVTRAQQLLTDIFIGESGLTTAPGLNFGAIPWGKGQQNRIGGYLCTSYGTIVPPATAPPYPVSAGQLYYVFPPTFSGNVEVRLTAKSDGGALSSVVVAPSGAPPASTGSPGILPINDMWTVGAWTNQIVSTNSTASPQAVSIYHFKIVSPTTAASTVDNVLTIGAGGTWIDWNITVTMYNTGLNYARVDRPIMSNPATGQVIDFPANVGSAP